VPAWDSTLKKLQSINPWRKIGGKTEINLDPTASTLFAGKKREKSKPTSIRSQTPLPRSAGHHGRRRREGERPTRESGGEKLNEEGSEPMDQVSTRVSWRNMMVDPLKRKVNALLTTKEGQEKESILSAQSVEYRAIC
jgi:hypothetical protein